LKSLNYDARSEKHQIRIKDVSEGGGGGVVQKNLIHFMPGTVYSTNFTFLGPRDS